MARRRRSHGTTTVGGVEPLLQPELEPAALRMLASAIAGRPVSVSTMSGDAAHTDGTTIFVRPGDTTTTVCLQAALIGAGSLEARSLRRVLGRKAVMPRYMMLEAQRAAVTLDRLLPLSVAAVVREHCHTPVSASPAESAQRAVRDRSVPDAPAEFGTLRRAALSSSITFGAGDGEEVEGEDSEDDSDGGVEKSSLLMAARFDNAFTKLMRELISPTASATEDDEGGGIETAVTSATKGSRHARAGNPVLARLSRFTAPPPDRRGRSYPEWNFRAGTYKPDWCTVADFDPAPQPDAEPMMMTSNRELVRAALRVTTVREPHNRQHSGDGLDIGALVRFEIAHRAGETPDDRVMRARLRTASELSVMLLIDCSGSGAETSAGKAIWEHQRQVGAQFLAAFDAAGARVAAYGFNSRGRSVQFLRIKSFAGRYGAAARERLSALQPTGYTRMGPAIRHATHLLSTEGGSDRRLLIVISDGLPYDDDYEGAYAENDTRHALEEAAASGVGCACFSVESPTEVTALERLWGSATYVQLTSERRWAQPVEATLQAAMRQAASVQKKRVPSHLGVPA